MTALTGLASHRDAVWVASTMTEADAREGARARRQAPDGPVAAGRRVLGAAGRERPRGLRPLLQHHRQPDALVHPALPLGPEQRAGHPPPRGRGVRVRLQRRQRGPGGRRRRGDRGALRARRDGPRLPPLHAAAARPARAARRVPAPLRPHPVVAERRLARAAQPHPRGDLLRAAGQRHHRLPHALLPAQLPAVLPRPDGPRGRLRARRGALRGSRGLGARLPAADRRARRPAASRPPSACRSSSASCSHAGAST